MPQKKRYSLGVPSTEAWGQVIAHVPPRVLLCIFAHCALLAHFCSRAVWTSLIQGLELGETEVA